MPSTTVGHALPTIIGSDRPCDAADTLCALRDRLNVLLNQYDNQINRAVAVVPAAELAWVNTDGVVQSPQITGDFAFPFSRVLIDTDNMTNLAADRRIITIRTPGRYYIGASIKYMNSAQNFQILQIFIQGGSFSGYLPGATGLTSSSLNMYASIGDMRQCSAGDQISLLISNTDDALGTDTVNCTLAAYWHADN